MNKKGLVWVLLGFFLFSGLILPVVSAETIGEQITAKILGSSLNISFFEGDLFKTILLFLLAACIIYSLGEFLPFLENKPYITGIVAIIVAILSTFYLTSNEIDTILLSYSALGIVITGIIPFLALAAISKKSYDQGHTILSKVLWVAFLVVLAIRWWEVDSSNSFAKITYPTIAVLTVIMIVADRWIYFRIFKATMRGEMDQSNRLYLDNLLARLEAAQERLASAKTDNARAGAEREVRDLEEKIGKATRFVGS